MGWRRRRAQRGERGPLALPDFVTLYLSMTAMALAFIGVLFAAVFIVDALLGD